MFVILCCLSSNILALHVPANINTHITKTSEIVDSFPGLLFTTNKRITSLLTFMLLLCDGDASWVQQVQHMMLGDVFIMS